MARRPWLPRSPSTQQFNENSPLLLLSALFGASVISAQNIIFEEDFTTDLGDAVFGYAGLKTTPVCSGMKMPLQVMEEGGRIEFNFDSTNAGGWFGGAGGCGVSVATPNLPEEIRLSDLAMEVDLSALGGTDRDRGSVRVTIDFMDEEGTFLKTWRTGAVDRGLRDAGRLREPGQSGFRVLAMIPSPVVTASKPCKPPPAGPSIFNDVIVWLEVGDGPGTFENSSGNSIRLPRVALYHLP